MVASVRSATLARGRHGDRQSGPQAIVLLLAVLALCPAAAHAGQFDALVSPGPLSRAHGDLRGLTKCVECHDPGRGVSAERCLACHDPIAERIAKRTGVHRAVTNDCVACHVEHAGVDADMRQIDPATFDHVVETGYALTNRHAPLAEKCSACHTTRSYLEARPVCSTCHEDKHTPTLGSDCARCHSTRTTFEETRSTFDHETARFSLTGAHREVGCEKCHAESAFRGLVFDRCSACHSAPHRRRLGPACTTCHTTGTWETRRVDHGLTAFTLVGAHAQVDCVGCHATKTTTPLEFARCSACHDNVHRESIKDDCRACHTEISFRTAEFDHAERTAFPLVDKHDGLECAECHTSLSASDVSPAPRIVDFGGVRAECAACHEDTHRAEYGRLCDACHRPSTFKVDGFAHPRQPEFFAGSHEDADCVKCHVPVRGQQFTAVAFSGPVARASAPAMTCSVCHEDVHLGQVGTSCDRCHAIDAAEFAAPLFSHDRGTFPLTGKHSVVECAKCHETETRAYPAGTGTAMRLTPVSNECRTCHEDEHMGQLDRDCSTCHSPETFNVPAYEHASVSALFRGFHLRLLCTTCHKKETGDFPAGAGTAVRFQLAKACAACHRQLSGGSRAAARLEPAHSVGGNVHVR